MAPTLVFPLPPHPNNQALNSKTFKVPPIDGTLVGAEIYDWQLKNSPEHHVLEYLDDDGNVKSLRFCEIGPAIHRAARSIRKSMGASLVDPLKEEERKTVIGLVAAADFVTSMTLMLGIMRAGYVPFPISPRNSSAAVAHLLNKASVTHVIIGREQVYQTLVGDAFKTLDEQKIARPENSLFPVYEDFYSSDAPESDYIAPAFSHPGFDESCLMLHSSGSTAFPKPIHWTHRNWIALGNIPFFGERDITGMRLACHALNMYHGMGVIMCSWAMATGLILTTFKPSSPAITPLPDIVVREALALGSDYIMCVPSFVELWSQNEDYVQRLAKIEGLVYGGGPLNNEIGDYLTEKGVKIMTVYGSTEGGCMNLTFPKETDKDWDYFSMSAHIKAAWVPYEDNLYEFVMLCHDYHIPSVLNTVYEGVEGYATSDLLRPHPTKLGFWKVFGRTDDQIMHNTGEKTNPGPLESMLHQDPYVAGSVMFGRGRFNTGVLVEPKPEYQFDPSDERKLAEFRNKIWPTVERVNDYAPQHSRIFKEMILVAKPSKPFTFTTKKTVRRGAVLREYENEIDELYAAFEETTQSDIVPPSVWEAQSIFAYIDTVVKRVLKKEISDTDDIFEHGCDSLQATWIRNTILHSLRESAKIETRVIPNQFVYNYPSINGLASYITSIAGGEITPNSNSSAEKIDEVHAMLRKYTNNFPKHISSATITTPIKYTVLLTGSTGGLGTSILAQLAASPEVSQIYLLNRKAHDGSPLVDRQRLALKDRGHDSTILDHENIILLEGDTAQANLGVSKEIYYELQHSVTHIIHNAWRVNFILSLASFEANVKGVRNLIDLALTSTLPTPPRFLFTSSVGVFRNIEWAEPIPETPISAEVAVGSGYSESKWISEKLLEIAAAQTPLRPVIIRVGQLTGSVNGNWNETEWLPSIVKSGPSLHCLPESAGNERISWIPLSIAASAVVDFMNAVSTHIHLIHPRPSTWSDVFVPFSNALNVPLVPYAEWLSRLQKLVEDHPESEVELMRQVPALKLIDFYRDSSYLFDKPATEAMGISLLSTENAVKNSPTLADANLPTLGSEDAKRWLNFWKLV